MKKIFTVINLLIVTNVFCQNTDNELTPYLIEKKYVFCNSNGVQKIQSTFDYAEPFNYEYAIVANNNEFGVIGKTGNYIVPLKFRKVEMHTSSTQEGKKNPYGIYFSINYDSCFYSYTGATLKNKPARDIYGTGYHEEHYTIYESKKYGYIEDGDTLIQPQYEALSRPCEGYTILIAKKGNNYGIISTENKILVPFNYSMIRWLPEFYIFEFEQEGTQGHCYLNFRGSSPEDITLLCGYKKVLQRNNKYLLVESNENQIFYVDMYTGKECKK